MLPTDIVPLRDWSELKEKVQDRFGLDVSVFDGSGKRITDEREWVNRMCPAIKATEKGRTHICAVAHNNIVAVARKSGRAIVDECDAGFFKVVVPIFVDRMFVGVVAGCGKVPAGEEIDENLIARIAGISEGDIAELATDLPTISEEDMQGVVKLISEELEGFLKRTDS